MSNRRIKTAAALLYILSVICFFAPVAWSVAEKFPIWRTQRGGGFAIGGGAVIVGIVAYMTFKRYITAFTAEYLGTMSAGVALVFIWFGLSLSLYALSCLTTMLNDLSTVFLWAGIGAVGGVACQFWAKCLKKE